MSENNLKQQILEIDENDFILHKKYIVGREREILINSICMESDFVLITEGDDGIMINYLNIEDVMDIGDLGLQVKELVKNKKDGVVITLLMNNSSQFLIYNLEAKAIYI
jgi:hypothetical protein